MGIFTISTGAGFLPSTVAWTHVEDARTFVATCNEKEEEAAKTMCTKYMGFLAELVGKCLCIL